MSLNVEVQRTNPLTTKCSQTTTTTTTKSTSNSQICARFLVPTLVSCAIFVAQFSADLVVAVQHFREKNPIWGGSTLTIIYAPAVAYFLLTVSRPDWWMTERDKSRKNGIVVWLLLQILRLAAFPFFALFRFATQIVLSVDAIIVSGEERQKTLNEISAPAAIEFYFFLQAWFQAIPQALFQMHLFFHERTVQPTFQSQVVQMFSILMSIIVVAKTTTSFQRYESQRVSGRKLPWAMWYKKYNPQEMKNLEEKQPLHSENMITGLNVEQPLEQKSSENKEPEKRIVLERKHSSTPPLPPKNAQAIPPPMPLRRITSITPLPVPDMPAPPRPDSITIEADQSDGSVTRYANSEAAEKLNPDQTSMSLRLPKRTLPSQGLDEDDTVGAMLAFSWWFLFIFARILSIIIFFEFFPYYLAAIIGIHYVTMIAYLFYQSKFLDFANVFINLWLGFIYIFSVIEYRVKLVHADTWLLLYYTFVIIQNSAMSVTWYLLGSWTSIWLEFIFYGIVVTMVLCVIITAVYFAMVKPKKRRIYVT